MSVCEFQHKRRLPKPDEPIENELTYGIVYRKKKKEDRGISPVKSPLNLPYKICLAEQTLKQKQWKIEQQTLKHPKKTIPEPKKYNLLQLNSFSQKQYMKYLAQPKKKVEKPRFKPPPPPSPKKYCKSLNFFSPRLEQMAVPKKRRVFSTWQAFQSILPIEAQLRFQKILHCDQNVDPKTAREYFKRIDKEKQKKKRAKLRLKRKKALEKKRGDKKWIKQQIDKVADKIVEFFFNEPLFTLNYKQLLLSDGILSTLERNKVLKKPNRQTKSHYKKSIVDISDKCAVWIDMLAQFVDVQLVDSDQDLPSTIVSSIMEEEAEEETEESEYSSEEEESEPKEGPSVIIWDEDEEEGEEGFEYPEDILERPEEAAEEPLESEMETEVVEEVEEQEEDNAEEEEAPQDGLETIKETEEGETDKQEEDEGEKGPEDAIEEVVNDVVEEETPPEVVEEEATPEVVDEVKIEEDAKIDDEIKPEDDKEEPVAEEATVDEEPIAPEEIDEGKEPETAVEEAKEVEIEGVEEVEGEEATEVEAVEEVEVEEVEEEGEEEGEEEAIEEEIEEAAKEEPEEVKEEPVLEIPQVEEPKTIVAEHYPKLVCCVSIKSCTLWLLYIVQNAHQWTVQIEKTIREIRHYAKVLRGQSRTPNGDVEAFNPQDWLAFIKDSENKQRSWQKYSQEVKHLTDEIVRRYRIKKMKCCPKCVQDNLIKNVTMAHSTIQSLTEAMNNASNWQMSLDKLIRKNYNLASSSFHKPQIRTNVKRDTYEIEEVDPTIYGQY